MPNKTQQGIVGITALTMVNMVDLREFRCSVHGVTTKPIKGAAYDGLFPCDALSLTRRTFLSLCMANHVTTACFATRNG